MAHAAGESVGDDVNKDDSPDYDAKLDFFSAEFDPLKALQAEGLNIPVTGAKIYDNISQYESKCILGRNTQRKPEQKAGTSKEATIERRFEPHQLPQKGRRRDVSHKNVVERMATVKGPLQLLNRCKDDHKRIKVYTRHGYGMRGYLTGFVTAFDKFWNISLEDVYEKWTRARRRKYPALGDPATEDELKSYKTVKPPNVTVISRDKKCETCERRVEQLLIRGEQIVLIAVLTD